MNFEANDSDLDLEDEKKLVLSIPKDNQAFEIVYEKYMPLIYNYVYYRVKKREIAEDIVSLVFYKALSKIYLFRFRKLPFSSWLYRIAHNEVCNYHKRKNKLEKISTYIDELQESNEEQTIEVIQKPISYDLILPYLEQLSYEDKDILMLRFFEKKKFSEIAEILGKKESTLRTHLGRILKRLKKIIPKEVLDDSDQQIVV